jgi:hypothetical protein
MTKKRSTPTRARKAKKIGKARKATKAKTPATRPGGAATRRSSATRGATRGARAAVAIEAAPAPGTCLGLIAAGEIVQAAIPGGPHDIDSTLENAGLITPPQRAVFRAAVVNGVSAHGCSIDASDVPNAAATTLRAAREAVQQNAR